MKVELGEKSFIEFDIFRPKTYSFLADNKVKLKK